MTTQTFQPTAELCTTIFDDEIDDLITEYQYGVFHESHAAQRFAYIVSNLKRDFNTEKNWTVDEEEQFDAHVKQRLEEVRDLRKTCFRRAMKKRGILEAQQSNEPNAPLAWKELLEGPPEEEDWILWPLVERGRQVTLFSKPKQGKSLLALNLAAAAAAGRPRPDGQPQDPITILYLDMENGKNDLRKRLHNMQFSPADLENLIYISFPNTAPLDTQKGAEQLFELVARYEPDLVIFDTISRFLQGDENDSRPWLDMYRISFAPLKNKGIAVLRLDHTGKDATKGERGSSAKTSDIDESYYLTYDRTKGTRTIKHELTRTGAGHDKITLAIRENPFRHTLPNVLDTLEHDPILQLIHELDQIGVPSLANRKEAREFIKNTSIRASNDKLQEAVNRRRARALQEHPADKSADKSADSRTSTDKTTKPQLTPCPPLNGQARTGTQPPTPSDLPATLKVAGDGQAAKTEDEPKPSWEPIDLTPYLQETANKKEPLA